MQFSISVIPGPAFTYPNMYSESLRYEYPLNTDTSLLQTVFFVPGERKFLNSTRLILTPHNMDTFYGPLSICINSAWLNMI